VGLVVSRNSFERGTPHAPSVLTQQGSVKLGANSALNGTLTVREPSGT
jgi:hypothetical protein